jgi:TP901 family phage tail tape measure protein
VAETLPPAVLDLVVNTAEWLEGMAAAITGLKDLNASIAVSTDAARAMATQMTAASEEMAVAMTEAAGAIEAASAETVTSIEAMGAAATEAAVEFEAAAATIAESMAADEEEAQAAGGGIKAAMMLAVAAVVAVGAAGVEQAQKFQTATTRLVTSANETQGALGQVRDGILTLAGQVGFSAQQLAQGMYTVESAGFHAAYGLTVLKAAAEGAKDENASLTSVSNAVTDVLTDYHLKASDAATVTSQMVEAVSFGKTNFDEFSRSMSNILPIASSVGLSFGDVASVEAEMTAHGTTAQRASQDVANAIRSLIAPTNGMVKEFRALGISADDVQTHLSQDGLGGTLEWLNQVADKNAVAIGQTSTEAMRKLVGTAPGLQAILETTGENFGNLSAAVNAVSHATADAQGHVAGFAQVQQNFSQRVSEAKDALDALLIRIGEALLPILTQAMALVASFATTMSENFDKVTQAGSKLAKAIDLKPLGAAFDTLGRIIADDVFPAVKNLAVVFGPVLAGAIKNQIKIIGGLISALKPLLDAFKSLTDFIAQHAVAFQALAVGILAIMGAVKTFTTVMAILNGVVVVSEAVWAAFDVILDANPIVLIILAIIGLVAAIVYLVEHSQSFRDFWIRMWNDTVAAVHVAVNWIKNLATEIGDGIASAANAVGRHVDEIISWFKGLPDRAGRALDSLGATIKNIATDAWGKFKEAVKDGVDATVDFVKHLPYEIGFAIGFLAGVIYGEAKKAGKALVDGIKDVAGDVKTFFTDTLPHAIHQALSSAKNWLTTTGKDILIGLEHGIVNGYEDVKKWWNDLPANLHKLLSDAAVWMATDGAKIIKGLIDGIVSAAKDVWKWWTDLPSTLHKLLGDAGAWLENTGNELVNGLVDGIETGAAAVWNWLTNTLPNTVRNIVSGARDWLVSAGRDIVRGLVDGVEAMGGWLWDQISSFVDGIVNGFHIGLSISSPSKVMADQVGTYITTGIAQGMLNAMPAVHGAIGAISGALTNTQNFGLPLAGAGLPGGIGGTAGVGGGNVVVINNNVAGTVVGETQLSDVVRQQVLRYNLRNPSNGLSLFGRGSS